MDGDKTSVFHDVDGSVSEYPGSYLIKEDNWLIKHRDCIEVPDWRGSICSGSYAQVYIQAYKSSNLKMKIIKNDFYTHPLYLEGALSKSTHYQQYQPVITLQKGYTIHWDKAAPEELTIWLINFNKNDWIQVGFCYPKGTTFSILSDIHDRLLKKTYKTGVFYPALQMDKLEYRYPTKGYYYWDEDTGLLFLKLKAQHEKEPFAFCSNRGCERIRIKANIPKQTGTSDCEALAYPKYAEKPTVDVPMPKKLPSAHMIKKDHFVELKIESYKTKYYHLKDDFAYISVDGKSFYLSEEGIQVVVIDGHEGKIVNRMSFKNIILHGIPAQIINYVNNIRNNSIVVMTSKGRFVSRSPWTKVLETLGAKPGFKLKDKMAFVGYKGSFRPFWIKLETDEDAVRIFQALPVPVVKKMKL
ncbi:PREDICTED: cell migration-inducing and hyaluronan-binding protein-like [Thamnophis sirtalis]|uniref:Cell migration-inducing and hyaluronan-binding protein-like n=1 Tax=Thamnophis sirtalis TaxID=35019 RepID=A0A6I9YZM6_9SAUR|nr:PREDICTED: cell migration-inducing and hyaluronan-binding protein-like [Thamnophis sirtalis]